MDKDSSSYHLEQNDKEDNINKYGKKKNNKDNKSSPFLIIVLCLLFLLLIFFIYLIISKNISKSNNTNDINTYNFTIISDNNKLYNITFENLHSHIKINANHKNKYYNEEYEKIFYLNDLKKNELFSLGNTIDEKYKKMINIIIHNNNKILIEQYNQINIIIPQEDINSKQLNLSIPININNNKEMNQQLLNKLNYLNEENNKLKYELKCYNEKNNNILKDEINKYVDTINIMNEQGSILLNLFGNIKIFNLSSIIKNNIEKIKLIIDLIKQKTNKNNIKFELIFKMSEQGSNSKDFHKYCDNQGPTLLLIETKDNKIFGGFTSLNWKLPENIERLIDSSDSTFLFSLSPKKKKFDMINKLDYAIRNDKDFGPIFGNFDLSLSGNMTRGGTFANNLCNFFSNNYLELTGDSGVTTDFDVKEFEVYKVIY